ncbi:MAG: helix-turn-helix transcriptional regulator [Blautia sp.]|nr:helix-turn-helix transcriptional regulator [Blautia sp.]
MTNTELTAIRESLNLNKSEFAAKLDVTAMLLGRYEKGSCAIPEGIAQKAQALVKPEEEEKPKRRGGRKKKETIEETISTPVEEVMPEPIVEQTAEDEAAAQTQAEDSVEELPEKAAQKKPKRTASGTKKSRKKTTPSLIIQSMLGGTITTEEILSRVPDDAEKVYVKPEENKAYWVRGEESGSVDLW